MPTDAPSCAPSAAPVQASDWAPGRDASPITVDAFLGGAVEIEQPAKGYRAGLDAVLLAASARDVQSGHGLPMRILDVGAGVGTAGLCLATRLENADVTLVERDPELSRLAAANVARNGLADRARVVTADVLAPVGVTATDRLEEASFDVAISNPPYLTHGRHRPSANALKAASHAMPPDGLDRWLRFMARMTRPGATVLMIHRADSLEALLTALSGRFGDVLILPLHPRDDAPASRVLVRATKASRAPLAIAPGRVLHEGDGAFRPEIKAVLTAPRAFSWMAAE